MIQPGSSWRCTAKEWEAMDTSDKKGNCDYILGVHGEGGEVLEQVPRGAVECSSLEFFKT